MIVEGKCIGDVAGICGIPEVCETAVGSGNNAELVEENGESLQLKEMVLLLPMRRHIDTGIGAQDVI
jgi:hypothetical protein